jgi:hypothetical protein
MKSSRPCYIILALIFSFISCTKEVSREQGTTPVVPGSGNFTATINGTAWSADSLQLAVVASGVLNITGLAKTGEQISIILSSFKTGTYTLNTTSPGYALYINLNDTQNNVYLSNVSVTSGTVVITAIDTIAKVISGTFSFTVTDPVSNATKTITNGVFNNVPYESGSTIPTGPMLSDTVLATIDNIKFNAAQVINTNNSGELDITGISANGTQVIDLLMPADIIAGTYTLDFNTGKYIGVYTNGINSVLISYENSGTLTILSNNGTTGRIIGTFSFVGTSLSDMTAKSDITKGYFSVSY